MVLGAVILGIFGFVFTAMSGRWLLWLHRVRKVSDVTGTVVGRDRQFSGRIFWTYPVVEFTTRDGEQIRRTFHQTARATIGRKLRIVYDPSAPDLRRSTSSGLTFESAVIYSAWMVLWFWQMTAVGLALLAACIYLGALAAG